MGAFADKKSDALFEAVANNNVTKVTRLIKSGVDVDARANPYNRTALMIAAWHNATAVAKLLIEAGADVNAMDNDGKTVLMYTVLDSDNVATGVAKLLIAAGADVNARKGNDNDDWTALFFAASREKAADVVKALLVAGADVNATCAGHTALMEASRTNAVDV